MKKEVGADMSSKSWITYGKSRMRCKFYGFARRQLPYEGILRKKLCTQQLSASVSSGQNLASVERTNVYTVEVEKKKDRSVRSLIVLLLLLHLLHRINNFSTEA